MSPARKLFPCPAASSWPGVRLRIVEAPAGQEVGGGRSPRDRAAGTTTLASVRALVVEDDDDAREIVCELLEAAGAVVVSVADATSALERLATGAIDVVVSDIGMPEMDGYTFMRMLRGRPAEQGGRTPAVAVTAFTRPEDTRRALDAGFQSHLGKPVDPDRLVAVVAELAGTDRE